MKPDLSNTFVHEITATKSPDVDASACEPTNTRLEIVHSPAPFCRQTVMLVLDHRGHLTPLYTAGDLLRWCKAIWKAELD